MCYLIIFSQESHFIRMQKLLSELENENFSDFEDCLQMECAKAYGADYIITRNVSDYAKSYVKAIEPKEYLKILE